jgi:hypothetical protein
MRLTRTLVATLVIAAAFSGGIEAKFGISKTRVTLKRTRPPDIPLVGDTVTVEVGSRARGVTDRQLDAIRQRVEDSISADSSKKLVARGADNVVQVGLDELDARINQTVTYETRRVKTGERQEWDAKKQKNVTKDIYSDRQEPVTVQHAQGHVSAHVEVETPSGPRTADASASYQDEFKGDVRIPAEASSEPQLERFLVDQAAGRAAAAVSYTVEPLEVLLAVDGDLKDGNRLAQAGLWKEALAAWVDRKPLKGDKEAARFHNIGVAHEALAYALPPDGPEHRARLEQAREAYRQALTLDRDEKYFAEPIQRIETSLEYAERSQKYAADAWKWKEAREKRSASSSRARRPEAEMVPSPVAASAPAVAAVPAGPKPRPVSPATARPAPAATAAPKSAPPADPLASSAGIAVPLRNGSFEAGLGPWAVTGKGAVAPEPKRGRVFQAVSTEGPTTLNQPIGVDVASAKAAVVALDYKVASGEGRVRVVVAYDDAGGRPRTSTLEVTAGDPAGDWTPWTGDLLALRPKASRVKEVRIVTEGATVLLDNVAVTVR